MAGLDKLAWVLLPLACITAALAVMAWRGRMPPRLALNVWFSLLLLVYLLTTAGLGIFWVAHQHLPVFDWHYLFGYATVLLLVVHLAFNARVVWRYYAQPRAPAAATAAQRRGALGWGLGLSAAAAGGLGYWLGLRHGRTELSLAAGPPAAHTDQHLAVVNTFHGFSGHTRGGVFRRAASASWGDPPPPFKHYPNAGRVALPGSTSVTDTAPASPLQALGAMLWHVSGVSARRGPITFRCSPSSGALFSTELYVWARDVPGLAPGLWHYDAERRGLTPLNAKLPTLEAWLGRVAQPGLSACVVATAVFGRSGHKYRDRAYRYIAADLGHALENLRVAAAALGWQAQLQARFDEGRIDADIGLRIEEESVLAVAALGRDAAAPLLGPPAGGWQAAPLEQTQDSALGLTQAIHQATSLRWRAGLSAVAPATPVMPVMRDEAAAQALPPPRRSGAHTLAQIASRRSLRRYDATPVSAQALSDVLHAMVRAQPGVLSQAVRLDVVIHAVQGWPAGAWRYTPQAHALAARVPAADAAELRRRSRRAGLDQDVIGDAAVVFVWSIDRAAMEADPTGAARGYRHAFIEAGLQSERLYLAAGALGLGVCAVGAFYDEEAAALVGVDLQREWVVHFAALGVPG
jgi:SagB-type dehydrogenase family enzyme